MELNNVQNKLERGMYNSVMWRQQRVAQTRELSSKKPDLESLYKINEEQKFGVWEKYLLKQRDKQKLLKKFEREKRKNHLEQKVKEEEKLERVKANIYNNNKDIKDKNADLNEKDVRRHEQIEQNE